MFDKALICPDQFIHIQTERDILKGGEGRLTVDYGGAQRFINKFSHFRDFIDYELYCTNYKAVY